MKNVSIINNSVGHFSLQKPLFGFPLWIYVSISHAAVIRITSSQEIKKDLTFTCSLWTFFLLLQTRSKRSDLFNLLWFFGASLQLPRLLLFDRRCSHHLFPFLALPPYLPFFTTGCVCFIFYISLGFFSPPCGFSRYHTIINITCQHPQFYRPWESTNGTRREMNVEITLTLKALHGYAASIYIFSYL